MNRRRSLVGVCLCVAVACGMSLPADAAQGATFNRDFFGVHSFYAGASIKWPGTADTPIPEFGGSWRLWNALGMEWREVEPQKGVWDFRYVDHYVDIAQAQHTSVLLTLGVTPQWASSRPDEKAGTGDGAAAPPRDIEDWRQYVKTVVGRYRGKIGAYELWNEPVLVETDPPAKRHGPAGFFSGSADELTQLAKVAYEEIKKDDPAAIVVTPSFVGHGKGIQRLREYLKHGGCAYADVIGFHFYQVESARPEDVVPLMQGVRKAADEAGCGSKPLWNTESGLIIQGPGNPVKALEEGGKGVLSIIQGEREAAAHLVRYLLLAASNGISRYYWFALDSGSMGLMSKPEGQKNRVLNEAGRTYGIAYHALLGWTMDSCAAKDTIWTCRLTRGSDVGWAVWNAAESPSQVPADPSWQGKPAGALGGAVALAGAQVTVDGMPLFIGPFAR